MASRFLVPDREQSFLQVASYRDLLGPDELVWTVIEVMEGMDLSAVYARYGVDTGQGGRPAFDPAMMLTLLVFGYCEGKRSARELEVACRRDVAYQAICGGMIPDHSTIARFRMLIDDIVELLFVQVLERCAERGLVDVGRVALDGTRIEANASKDANHNATRLAGLHAQISEILAETRPDTDSDDSDPDGSADGDGPDDDRGSGWSRLRRERDTVRRLDRIETAQVEAERARERREHDEKRRGRKRGGEPGGNVTDPDSRLQKTAGGGFIQGYNAQTVVSADQIVIAAHVTAETTDVGQFETMIKRTMSNLTAVDAATPGTVLADAGYWSLDNSRLEDDLDGTVLLIAPGDKTHTVGAIPDPLPDGVSDAGRARHRMQTRLADPDHRDAYRQRGWLVEGSFAHVKNHRRSRRFSRRGLAACQAEWLLINLAGNIRKLHQTRHRPPTSSPPPPDRPSQPSRWPQPAANSHNHPHRHHRLPAIRHHH